MTARQGNGQAFVPQHGAFYGRIFKPDAPEADIDPAFFQGGDLIKGRAFYQA